MNYQELANENEFKHNFGVCDESPPKSYLRQRFYRGDCQSTPLSRDGVVTAVSQRHRPADPAWACQLNEGEGSTGQSKNNGMIYPKRYNKTGFNSSLPGQIGHNSQTTFSNEFTWIKSFILWFNSYWCLFLRAQLTNKSALVDNKSMLVQAMDWHRVGDKPLSDTVHCRIEGTGWVDED